MPAARAMPAFSSHGAPEMCLGVPMQVVSVEGYSAVCEAGPRRETIDLALTGPLAPGTWVLVFLGAAREVLDAERAAQISDALDGLAGAMAGHGTGTAFADLEAREPTLPPHLEAARRAGRSAA